MKKSERSLRFKRRYYDWFQSGGDVKTIADHHGLSQRHSYVLIHELEDEMGLPRGTLLPRPHAEHAVLERKELKKVDPINFSAFQEEFRTTIDSMDKTLGLMGETLDNWPENPSLTPEREECL